MIKDMEELELKGLGVGNVLSIGELGRGRTRLFKKYLNATGLRRRI